MVLEKVVIDRDNNVDITLAIPIDDESPDPESPEPTPLDTESVACYVQRTFTLRFALAARPRDYLAVLAGQRQWIATTNFGRLPRPAPDSFANSAVLTTSAKFLMRWAGPSTRAFLCRLTPKRNSLSRLWPVQISDHSPFTFSSPRSRNCRNPRPCLIWPNTGSTVCIRKAVALPTRLVCSFPSHPVPGRQMAGYATSGRGWHNPAVAGLLRRDERVHAQSIELADCLCRVIASIGGYFPGDCADVVDGLLHHRRSLLLIRSLVGGPRRHDHLVSAVHHRLAVVRLQEVLSSRRGDDARLGIGEVTLGLVVGHPWVLTHLRPRPVRQPPAPRLPAPPWLPVSSPTDALERPTPPATHLHACLCRTAGLPHHPPPGPVATTPLPPPPTALPSPSSVW